MIPAKQLDPSAPHNSSAVSDAALLLHADAAHVETLRYAEERLYTLYRATALADTRHLVAVAPLPAERNAPSGIGALLARPDLLFSYLLAALRTSSFTRVSLLLPGVHTADEIVAVRRLTEQAELSLRERGIPFDELTETYALADTPEAVHRARDLAEECDLLAIDVDRLSAHLPHTFLKERNEQVLALLQSALADTHALRRRLAVAGTKFLSGLALHRLIEIGVDLLILPTPAFLTNGLC